MTGDSSSEARRLGRVRWLPLVAIVLGGGILLGVLQTPDLFKDDAHRNLATIAASLLVGGVLVLWVIFGTGLAPASQVRFFLGAAAVIAAVAGCFRVEGVSGNIWPRLTWRWAAKPDESLAADIPINSSSEPETVADLTKTTQYDFPQFLGPNRDATVATPPLPLDWAANPPRPLWRQPIGAGWSSFAVVGDYALTQEQRGNKELVTCYALATGELIWAHADEGRFSATLSGDGPRATPTIDEGRVYTLGALGLLNCLDGASGKVLWSHNVVKQNQASLPEWGKSCSPLIVDELVVVSAGGQDGHSLVAYDKRTGERVWHAGDQPSSYASPRLATLAGARQILMVNQALVAAHDPTNGDILWKFEWAGGEPKVPDAVAIDGNRVFIGAGYGLGCKLLRIERGDDGQLTANALWEKNHLKPKFTNVVVHAGFVYGLDDGKTLVCIDLNDGKRCWRGGRYGHGQILRVNDVLLIQAESGEVALVEASPLRFTELVRFAALGDQTWNNPVVAGRLLLVRNATEAACYELPVAE